MGAHQRRLVVAGEQGLVRSSFGQFRRVVISRACVCVGVPAVRLIRVDVTRVRVARVLGFAGGEGSSSDFGGVDSSGGTS